MKKLFKTLFLVSLLSALFLVSCEEPEPPRPACEVNGTGNVKIINHSGIVIEADMYDGRSHGERYCFAYRPYIKVDVYDGRYHGERYVYNGNSTTYYNVDADSFQIWSQDAYDDWGYWTYYLDECETFEFTLTSKKSGGKEYRVKIGSEE